MTHQGMKYTKEQAEVLALLVLMGCAIVVLAFLYLVKPNFEAVAASNKELKKIETEIEQLGKPTLDLAKAKKEMGSLMGIIEHGEGAIFPGLETNPPLTQICIQAAGKLKLKTELGAQTKDPLLEFKERGTDGTQVTSHYDEVRRTLDIPSVNFFTLCRFLSAVESANEGLRVTHLNFDNQKLDPQDQENGNVKAKVELSMLGIREGEGEPTDIDVSVSEELDVGQKRNPFGPPGKGPGPVEDPLRNIKDVLKGIKILGVWSDELLMDVPGMPSITVRRGETFVIGKTKLKYVSKVGDSHVFEAVDYGKRYTLITNWKGQVKTVTEEEVK